MLAYIILYMDVYYHDSKIFSYSVQEAQFDVSLMNRWKCWKSADLETEFIMTSFTDTIYMGANSFLAMILFSSEVGALRWFQPNHM